MPMHEMSDSHVLNAWHKLQEISNAGFEGETYFGEGEWTYYYNHELETSITESLEHLAIEAERRWDCDFGDGEKEIIRRWKQRADRSGPPIAPIVGRQHVPHT